MEFDDNLLKNDKVDLEILEPEDGSKGDILLRVKVSQLKLEIQINGKILIDTINQVINRKL